MGLIHIDIFTSADGVAQAPGGPDEDPSGGFTFGGWQEPLTDDIDGSQVMANMDGMDALLLGRRTYDIFAAYWPRHDSNPIGALFNRIPKYVASREERSLEWANSHQLGPDVAAAVNALRELHDHVHVIGSLDFVQTLFAEQAFDRLTLWVYPIFLGDGKKVFADGTVPTNLTLLEPASTSSKGAVQLRYARADGIPAVGQM